MTALCKELSFSVNPANPYAKSEEIIGFLTIVVKYEHFTSGKCFSN